MSKANESKRLLRSQKTKKDDDELFVKLPKFSKRVRGKSSLQKQEDESDVNSKAILPANERLYKFLKQPACQRWIWCEFLESFIDKTILASAYSPINYKQTRFAQLETDELPKRCWQFIRRLNGKPRRFSPAFIASEKAELERYRGVIRQLQQFRLDATQSVESLPKQIPMPLPMDAKVVSLLSKPLPMLRKGRVIGYDPKDCSYLVKFDMGGKHTVLSRADCYLYTLHECKSKSLADIINETPADNELDAVAEDTTGQKRCHPLFAALLQLQKQLTLKRKIISDITAINEEFVGGGVPVAATRRDIKLTPQLEKLQHRYASNIITLHRVNAEILDNLRVAHEQMVVYEKDYLQNNDIPCNKILEKCRFLAERDLKASSNQMYLKGQATRELILQLQTLLYLCTELGQGNDIEVNAVLDDYINKLVTESTPEHLADFQHVIGILHKLRDQITTMWNLESERRQQQLLQVQQSDIASFVITEEGDIDMSL
ncbi:protein lin-9 [Drosophila sulfurigaster albostrigata]|uniref:protein lin-9 n=1 Tax=Drosophila sulfurigaster albostrigata TaxID=89887 RepID=UPI002D21BF0A|nr:protein lin-9 [Drosophila sulfurigaster albostrigata]